MPKRKQSSSVLSIVAYTPPKLYVGVEWYIGFMAFDPATLKMRRKKIKLNHISKIGERRIYAKDLINRLSEQLRRGWNRGSRNLVGICIYLSDSKKEELFIHHSV